MKAQKTKAGLLTSQPKIRPLEIALIFLPLLALVPNFSRVPVLSYNGLATQELVYSWAARGITLRGVCAKAVARAVAASGCAGVLELGASFHPALAGRENIFLNGTLLGCSRAEMIERFSDIVDFAELWDFIGAPLRTYSGGLVVRPGSAVATAIEPDILVADEVLAVGHESFQQKCAAQVAQFTRRGVTILLATHGLPLARQMRHRATWFDHGQVRACGSADEVIRQ
jgi:ABC-type polysaccharide/polyol phosphate transport system ATPase subunit